MLPNGQIVTFDEPNQDADIAEEISWLRRQRDDARSEAVCLREQVAALARQSASHDFLSDAKDEIWELFVAVRDDFDGSEYQQGKKDGLRSALALLAHGNQR